MTVVLYFVLIPVGIIAWVHIIAGVIDAVDDYRWSRRIKDIDKP